MFGDLDWPLNASRGLSAIAEFLVILRCTLRCCDSAMGKTRSFRTGDGKCGTRKWVKCRAGRVKRGVDAVTPRRSFFFCPVVSSAALFRSPKHSAQHTATDRRVRRVRALAINFDRGPAGRPARGERRPQQIYTAERLAYGVARKFNLRSLCWVSRLADRPDVWDRPKLTTCLLTNWSGIRRRWAAQGSEPMIYILRPRME